MADVRQIKIGSNTYNIKDYGIRPNVTECYKRLYNGNVAHTKLFTMNAAWPRYHLYGSMYDSYGIMLIGTRTGIDTEYTSDTMGIQIHTMNSYDSGTHSYIMKASAIRNVEGVANRFTYLGSWHKLNTEMTGSNPNLVGVWGFF